MARRRNVVVSGLAALALATSLHAPLVGQELTYDAANRLYTLSYFDDDGVQRVVQIVPPNHVGPVFDVDIVDAGGGFLEFNYSFGNLSSADQAIRAVGFDCPGLGQNVSVSAPTGWRPLHELTFRDGSSPVCRFVVRSKHHVIMPDASLGGFRVATNFLPGVVDAAIWGQLDSLPTLTGLFEVPPEIAELVDAARGITGGWLESSSVAPVYDPSEASEADGVSLMISELDDLCVLGWIEEGGVCNSLRAKLEQAIASIIADRPTARQQVQAFLNELDAQRGQHVTGNAYGVLHTLGEYVLSTI